MSKTSRLFIYDGYGIDPTCLNDLKTFLAEHVVATKDITVGDIFHKNYDQLTADDNPTIVVPGGGLFDFTFSFDSDSPRLATLVNENGFNFVGSCLGGYLAGKTIKLMILPEQNQHRLPLFSGRVFNDDDPNQPYGITNSYNPVGPVCFHEDPEKRIPRKSISNASAINISVGKETIPQLLLSGCTYEANGNTDDGTQVVATYTGREVSFNIKICKRK